MRSAFGLARLVLLLAIAMQAASAQAAPDANQAWWDTAVERKVGSYWIKSELPAAQVNAIGRHLNILRSEYDKALVGVPVRVQEKLNVLIFNTRAECEATLHEQFGASAAEQGGLIVWPGQHALVLWMENQSVRQLEQLIQREAFRQFAFNRFGGDLPIVLEQGLAEMFGEATLAGEALIFGQSTPQQVVNVQSAVQAGTHIPLQTLLTMTPQEWMAQTSSIDSAALLYRQARSLALFMLHSDRPAYTKYLRNLNNGLPAQHAFERSYGVTYQVFEKRWKEFVSSMRAGAMVTAMQRMEFLAEGALELHRRQIFPQNLDELRTRLREIGFNYTVVTARDDVFMTAAENAPFEIPRDGLTTSQPAFIVTKQKLPTIRRERDLEEANPTPPAIVTQHLRPAGLQIKWVRDAENKSFHYQILAR